MFVQATTADDGGWFGEPAGWIGGWGWAVDQDLKRHTGTALELRQMTSIAGDRQAAWVDYQAG
jgi:hypothetical protein